MRADPFHNAGLWKIFDTAKLSQLHDQYQSVLCLDKSEKEEKAINWLVSLFSRTVSVLVLVLVLVLC